MWNENTIIILILPVYINLKQERKWSVQSLQNYIENKKTPIESSKKIKNNKLLKESRSIEQFFGFLLQFKNINILGVKSKEIRVW